MGTGGTATFNPATGALTLNAAATADNAAIVCTFTNALNTTDLSITKTDNVTSYSASQLLTYTYKVTDSGQTDITHPRSASCRSAGRAPRPIPVAVPPRSAR